MWRPARLPAVGCSLRNFAKVDWLRHRERSRVVECASSLRKFAVRIGATRSTWKATMPSAGKGRIPSSHLPAAPHQPPTEMVATAGNQCHVGYRVDLGVPGASPLRTQRVASRNRNRRNSSLLPDSPESNSSVPDLDPRDPRTWTPATLEPKQDTPDTSTPSVTSMSPSRATARSWAGAWTTRLCARTRRT